jgi:hypothetical protein
MKNERKHNIDKLFLESLDGHKIDPSPGVWESLSGHIPSKGGKGIILFLITAVAIGGISILLNMVLQPGSTTASVNNFESSLTSADEPVQALSEAIHTAIYTEDPAPLPVSGSVTSNQQTASEAVPEPGNIHTVTSAGKLNEYGASPAIESTISQEGQVIIYTHINRLDYCPYTIDISTDHKLISSELRNSGEPFFDLNIKDNYVKKAEMMFGAGFTPAVNIYPDGQNRNDYSLELIAAYEKSRFILESGIGANFTSESAKYQVNYSSYDSVGYYIRVSSFSIAPGNPDSVIFETNLKSVYDSIDHYQIKENTNKFVYLQIPLRIGYRIIEVNRFSLDLKAGILFSLQVYRDVPEVPYQGSDAEQIEVIRHYPDRLKSTWQYTASLGFNYQINRQTRFSLEPVYRQYINSVYSTGSEYPARSPYSFGIRGGIYFHF